MGLVLLLLFACGENDGEFTQSGQGEGTTGRAPGAGDTASGTNDDVGDDGETTGDAGDAGDGGGVEAPAILSAYYGLDMLPPQIVALCGPSSIGEDGMPVTFSIQLDAATVEPSDFEVEKADGELVTPTCATLSPANEPLELRTMLLAGPFGTAAAQPVAVEVVGDVNTVDGKPIGPLRSDTITPLEAGPTLLLAERFDPGTPGLEDECPATTHQVVQLMWDGGVSGPDGAALSEAQRLGVHVRLDSGQTVEPTALGDDDPDNFILACLDSESPAIEVTVDADLFHDPGDDPNPATAAEVTTPG